MTNDNPGRIAVAIADQIKTYGDLNSHVDAMVNWLGAQWNPNWRQVGICMRHQYWHWVTSLALIRMGKSAASVTQPKRAQEVLPFDVWVTDKALLVRAPVLSVDPVTLQAEGFWNQAAHPHADCHSDVLNLLVHPEAERLLLTSGTTGRPKVVRINSADLTTRVDAALQQYDGVVTPGTRLLPLMGIETLGGFFFTLVTLLKGGTILMGAPSSTESRQSNVPYQACNVLSVSPAVLVALLERSEKRWPGHEHRQVRVGGSRLHPRVRDGALQKIGYQVTSTYGASELGLIATCDAQAFDMAPGLAGRVFANVQVQVVDRHDIPLPAGQQGRIRCQAPGMAKQYDGDEACPNFVDGWFYPGDLGTLSDDGWLVITGREDDILNFGGRKISAVDLETLVQHFDGVKDVCVSLIERGERPTLVIALVLEDDADTKPIGQALAGKVPRDVPFYLVRKPTLPRNAMGKLDRLLIVEQLKQAMN